MKKFLLLIVSVFMLACSFTSNVLAEDVADVYVSEINGKLNEETSVGFDLTASVNNKGWSYFDYNPQGPNVDSINAVKLEKYDSSQSEYIPMKDESNIGVLISQESNTVILTPNSSEIFSKIEIKNNEAKIFNKVIDDDSNNFRITVTFGLPPQGGGGGNNDSGEMSEYIFEKGGKKYSIGIANGSAGGSNIHLDGGFRLPVDNKDEKLEYYKYYLAIANIDDNNNVLGVASQDIYSGLTDVKIEIIKNDNGFISNPNIITGQNAFSRSGVNQIDFELNCREAARGKVKITFNYDGEPHEVIWPVEIYGSTTIEVSLEDATSVDDINAVLGSVESLQNKIVNSDSITENDVIHIKLKKDQTYKGIIKLDTISDNFVYEELVIEGDKTTIKGCLNIKSGFVNLKGIDFVKADDESANVTVEGVSHKVGVFVNQNEPNETGRPYRTELTGMSNCSFSGYDYGIAATGYTNAASIVNTKFINCNTGYYLNSNGWDHGGPVLHNSFINCAVGIEIANVPINKSAYQMEYSDNMFFNEGNCVDYKVDCNNIFFFTRSYFGKTFDLSKSLQENMTAGNLRNAKISYPNKGMIYTNPCIRYPQHIGFDSLDDPTVFVNPQILGIDNADGLHAGIVYSEGGNKLNGSFLNDVEGDKIDIDLCKDGTGERLASISFDVTAE